MAGQEITWKFETPLEGRYLAHGFYGGITPGVVEPVRASFSGTALTIQPFQAFLNPKTVSSGAITQSELLVKVTLTLPVSIESTLANVYAVGMTYTWEESSVREAEFETLTEAQTRGYDGIIVGLVDFAAKRFWPHAADFSNVYSNKIARPGYFLRPGMARDTRSFSTTWFQLATNAGEADDYTITIQYTNELTYASERYIATVADGVNFQGITPGLWYAVGFQLSYTGSADTPRTTDLPFVIVNSTGTSSPEKIKFQTGYAVFAVVYWTGDATTSDVYSCRSDSYGVPFVASTETGTELPDLTVFDNAANPHQRIVFRPEGLYAQYRESSVGAWTTVSEVGNGYFAAAFYQSVQPDDRVYYGNSTRDVADIYCAAVGFCPYDSSLFSRRVQSPALSRFLFWHSPRICNVGGRFAWESNYRQLDGQDPVAELIFDSKTTPGYVLNPDIVPYLELIEDDTLPVSDPNAKWGALPVVKLNYASELPFCPVDDGNPQSGVLSYWVKAGGDTITFVTFTWPGTIVNLGMMGQTLQYWGDGFPAVWNEITDESPVYHGLDGNGWFVQDDAIYGVKIFPAAGTSYPLNLYIRNDTTHVLWVEHTADGHLGVELAPGNTGILYYRSDAAGDVDLTLKNVFYTEPTDTETLPYTDIVAAEDGFLVTDSSFNEVKTDYHEGLFVRNLWSNHCIWWRAGEDAKSVVFSLRVDGNVYRDVLVLDSPDIYASFVAMASGDFKIGFNFSNSDLYFADVVLAPYMLEGVPYDWTRYSNLPVSHVDFVNKSPVLSFVGGQTLTGPFAEGAFRYSGTVDLRGNLLSSDSSKAYFREVILEALDLYQVPHVKPVDLVDLVDPVDPVDP